MEPGSWSTPTEEQKVGAGEAPPATPPPVAAVALVVTQEDIESASGEIANYLLYEKMGFGASCKVYKAKCVHTGRLAAVKIARGNCSNQKFKKLTEAEVTAMRNLNHPNILRLYDHGEAMLVENGRPKGLRQFLALEIAENGELFDYIFHGGKLELPIVKFYMSQLIAGLNYLHK